MKLVKETKSQDINIQKPGPTNELVEECLHLLIDQKNKLLNQLTVAQREYRGRDRSGDEVDQSLEVLEEHKFFAKQERIRAQLLEIEFALGRIEAGSFGVCEETEEFIETDRLRAIPWTRLSIEGAELRESLKKRFAK